jgi:hypothetical protein
VATVLLPVVCMALLHASALQELVMKNFELTMTAAQQKTSISSP